MECSLQVQELVFGDVFPCVSYIPPNVFNESLFCILT